MPVCEDVQGTGRDLGVRHALARRAGRVLIAELRVALGPDALRIDHIGSTAIPGMDAKDVLGLSGQRRRPGARGTAIRLAARADALRAVTVRTRSCARGPSTTRSCGPSGCGRGAITWTATSTCMCASPARPTSVPLLLFCYRMRAHPEAIAPYGAFKRSSPHGSRCRVVLRGEGSGRRPGHRRRRAMGVGDRVEHGKSIRRCPVMVENAPVEPIIERVRWRVLLSVRVGTAGTPTFGVCSMTETCSWPSLWDLSNRGTPEMSPRSVASSRVVSSSAAPPRSRRGGLRRHPQTRCVVPRREARDRERSRLSRHTTRPADPAGVSAAR